MSSLQYAYGCCHGHKFCNQCIKEINACIIWQAILEMYQKTLKYYLSTTPRILKHAKTVVFVQHCRALTDTCGDMYNDRDRASSVQGLHTPDNALWVWMLGNQQGGPTANWFTGPVVSTRWTYSELMHCTSGVHEESLAIAGMISSEMLTLVTWPISHHCHPLSSLVVFLSLGILSEWIRMQTPVKSFWASSQELETSTWVAKYYLDKDHPRWSLFRGSGAAWSQRTGSESTSLEINVFV